MFFLPFVCLFYTFMKFSPFLFVLIGSLMFISWGDISAFWEVISGEERKIVVSGELSHGKPPHIMKNTLSLREAPFFFSKIDNIVHREKSTWDDGSISRFVTKSIPLTDREYEPDDLVSITGASLEQGGRYSTLRRGARDALTDMARDFEREFGKPLVVVSGYRSAKYQQRLWDLGRCTDTLCAPPGYSEHQLGLAIDIFDATNEDDYMANTNRRKYIAWVQKNAHTYGYTQSYQQWPSHDAYDIEPWHWRYVSIALATKLYHLRMTYSEYVEFESMLSFWSI